MKIDVPAFNRRFGQNKLLIAGICLSLVILAAVAKLAERQAEVYIEQQLTTLSEEVGVGLGLRQLSLHALRLNPVVVLEGVSIGVPERQLAVRDANLSLTMRWSQLLGAKLTELAIGIETASLNVSVDSDGSSNWDTVVEGVARLRRENPNEQSFSFSTISIKDSAVSYQNKHLSHRGDFLIEGNLHQLSQLDLSSLEITGNLNDYLIRIDGSTYNGHESRLDTGGSEHEWTVEAGDFGLELSAEIAQLNLVLQARSSKPFNLNSFESRVEVSGIGLNEVLRDLNLFKTRVSDVAGVIDLKANKGIYTAATSTEPFKLGSSDFSLSLNLNSNTHPMLFDGTFHSSQSSIDELLGIGDKHLAVDAPKKTDKNKRRIFSTAPFSASHWISDLEGEILLNLNNVQRGAASMAAMQGKAELKNSSAVVSINSESVDGGSVTVDATLEAGQQGSIGTRSSRIAMNMQRIELQELLALTGLPSTASRGKISGEGTFWFEGFSPSSFVSSTDGGLFLLIEDGEIDSLLVEMAGVDVMESINLIINRNLQQSEIRCGFLDVQATSGSLEIIDFILDTEDSVFLAKGGIDLVNETIDLKFEPHPRDASFFAAPTALLVSGSLSSPTFRPGTSLLSRLAIAGALASLATPAAIVLPFIEIGQGSTPSSCVELFTQ